MPDPRATCGTCVHWTPTIHPFGSCRERPPAALVVPGVLAWLFGRSRTVWPLTKDTDRCGAWVLDAARLERKRKRTT